jgi:hypothetical protein
MSKRPNESWPLIIEDKEPRKRSKGSRKFIIQDARNTWEIVAVKAEEIRFEIAGFSKFYFKFDGDLLRCYKKIVVRASDSGELACFDDRFNLVDDKGERKTLRLKNLKQYVKNLFK